jgi:hypothetical protein
MTKIPETWVDVVGYEGSYSISNLGRVMSHHRNKHRLLQSCTNGRGYAYVTLSQNGIGKSFRVHVLVAKHFLPKPQGTVEVNHKDENKLNNQVDNLEWCSKKHNINYGTRIERVRAKLSKPVNQYSKTGKYINSYASINQASLIVGVSSPHIVHCCKGARRYAGGFVWKYVTEVLNETPQ